MGQYRRLPTVVEARQFTGESLQAHHDLAAWCGGRVLLEDRGIESRVLALDTLEDTLHAPYGSWIVRGVHGEFYPVEASIFEKTYAPIDRMPSDFLARIEQLTREGRLVTHEEARQILQEERQLVLHLNRAHMSNILVSHFAAPFGFEDLLDMLGEAVMPDPRFERIRSLHQPEPEATTGREICAEDRHVWPCRTAKIWLG